MIANEAGWLAVQRQLTHATSQAALMPRQAVDPQQETVGDDSGATGAILCSGASTAAAATTAAIAATYR